MNEKTWLRSIQGAMGLIGLAVLWAGANWQVALGVFLMLWAENLRRPPGPGL